jgi:pentatricopeptide repeat protein
MASLSFLAARGIIGAGASLCRPRPRSGADVGAACMSALTANASDQEPPQQQQQQQQHPKKNKKMPTRAASGAKQRTGTLRGGTVRNAPEKDRIHKNERVKLVDDMFHPLPAPTGQVHGGEQFDRCIASFLKKIGPSLGVEMLSAEEDARLAAQDESKSEKPREKNDLKHRIMAAAEAGSLASMTRIWHEIISNEKMGNFIRLDLRSYQDMMGMFVEAPDVTPQSRVFQVYKRCCKQGSTPNAVMYNRYMRACAKLGDGDRARELILSLEDAPPENFSPSSSFLYNLIISLSRGGYSSDAQRYVELMKNLGHTGTPVVYQQYIWSWTRPDKATGKAPDLEKAVQAIDDMLAAELVPAPRLIAHVLMLAVRQEKAEHTLKLLRLLRGLKGQLAASECTILLHFAANDGNAVLTQEIWQATEEWGIERCPSMYNAVVVALANAGNISDALVALMDMISEGREVRNRTINSVAFRISTSVKRIDNMYYFLAHLKENGKKIPVEAINCIVLACSKRCQVDR